MMIKKITFLLFMSALACTRGYAQSDVQSDTENQIGVKVSYFGEFVLHPGFAAGIDYSIYSTKWFNLHWDSELGAYYHKWNNNAAFIQSSIGTRFISSFSVFWDVNAGLGYMLSSPNGEVYTLDENGALSEKGRPYTSHLKPHVSVLFGWDGRRNKDIPLLIHAGIEAYWQSHFNHSMLPHAAFRLGIVHMLKAN